MSITSLLNGERFDLEGERPSHLRGDGPTAPSSAHPSSGSGPFLTTRQARHRLRIFVRQVPASSNAATKNMIPQKYCGSIICIAHHHEQRSRQNHACHVAARGTFIPDQARLICQRRNRHHLVHYGFAPRTCKALALWKVRHATRTYPQRKTPPTK